MFGVVTRNEAETEWAEFDRACYEVKDVTGRAADPIPTAVNMISCFGDTATATADPSLVPVSDEGELATRERPYFDWGYICPTHPDYRAGVLETVQAAAAVTPDVRLDDVGFPRGEYCHCERCTRLFADSDCDERGVWRAGVITDFVAAARERVPGRLSLTLYPDPYPGHLYERAGLDLDALADNVDEFVVPLYDMAYTTTYWLEVIASGFADRLETPLAIELYAVEVDVESLVHAMEVASAYAETVFLGYDAGNARAAIRRYRADAREGESYGG